MSELVAAEPTQAAAPPAVLDIAEDGIEIRSTADLMQFARMVATSDLAPKDYRGKPANVFIAVQMGREIGLSPMHALQAICVINGRPTVYGDALLAIVRASGAMEAHDERWDGVPFEDDYRAIATTTRVGMAPHVAAFSVADAKQAKLWRKAGPWTDYPKRMLMWRARAWALRDVYGDKLAGMHVTEEFRDMMPAPDDRGRGVETLRQRILVASTTTTTTEV